MLVRYCMLSEYVFYAVHRACTAPEYYLAWLVHRWIACLVSTQQLVSTYPLLVSSILSTAPEYLGTWIACSVEYIARWIAHVS